MLRTALLAPATLVAFSALAGAQQFQLQPGAIPGPNRWTEGVECVDVDHDGDLDILFADGEGFSGAGTQRQNTLIINQTAQGSPGVYTDESVARFGANVSNAKGVSTADVDGDGWEDVMFANAFNTGVPHLYINRGAAQPGFFDLESTTRGFTEALSSAACQFGDVDDDGDYDVMLNDSGNSFLGGSGGVPRLYINDGTGHFTESPLPAATNKIAHMDAQFVDIDNDWDLDYVGINRASSHFLLLNNGAGSFSDASGVMPSTGSVYEAESGDLDGDMDLDFFFLSLGGFREGHVENNLVPTTTLSFTSGALQPGNVDDNEVVFLDYDNDGDYDPMVGSLGSQERVYINAGGLVFTPSTSVIQNVADPTLDMTAADLDNDGDYDLITAQGEGASSQWGNKIYVNTGAADTLPPVIRAIDAPTAPEDWPVIVHAKMQDQLVDDGITFVTGQIEYAAVGATVDVAHGSGMFVPAVLNVSVGDRVRFTNFDGTPETVTSQTAPYGYDLSLPSGGGSADYVFVRPGTYDYASAGSGATGQIVVTGTSEVAPATTFRGEFYRFELGELPFAASGQLAFELSFTDWPGNVSVSESQTLPFPLCTPEPYCVGKTNSLGCVPFLTTSGTGSATSSSAFSIRAEDVLPGEAGFLLYSFKKSNLNFHGGKLCVKAPITRLLPPKVAKTTGSPPCTGFVNRNFNAAIQSGNDVFLTAGQTVSAQWRLRDPADPAGFGDGLSNAVRFVICP